jgi:hypothetical protein
MFRSHAKLLPPNGKNGMLMGKRLDGRGGGIRTPDPLVPNQMRYQTALRPDKD